MAAVCCLEVVNGIINVVVRFELRSSRCSGSVAYCTTFRACFGCQATLIIAIVSYLFLFANRGANIIQHEKPMQPSCRRSALQWARPILDCSLARLIKPWRQAAGLWNVMHPQQVTAVGPAVCGTGSQLPSRRFNYSKCTNLLTTTINSA